MAAHSWCNTHSAFGDRASGYRFEGRCEAAERWLHYDQRLQVCEKSAVAGLLQCCLVGWCVKLSAVKLSACSGKRDTQRHPHIGGHTARSVLPDRHDQYNCTASAQHQLVVQVLWLAVWGPSLLPRCCCCTHGLCILVGHGRSWSSVQQVVPKLASGLDLGQFFWAQDSTWQRNDVRKRPEVT